MYPDLKVLIVGGVAAGPKVAARVKRLQPSAEVTLVEKGTLLSYAGCGLPYYISDVVKERDDLMATPVGVVRDAAFFEKVKEFKALTETEAMEIDRVGKRLRVAGKDDESWLPYDYLVLATGAQSVKPPIPGVDIPGVYPLKQVEDADRLKSVLTDKSVKRAVVIGGGLIGMEMVETLLELGREVTVVEMLPQILPMLDWELARFVENHLRAKGVKILTGARVTGMSGEGRVKSVETTEGELPADLVLYSVGVRPQITLANEAGLEIGSTGAIKVNTQMQTSDPFILAAGDCVECVDAQTGQPCYIPLGSTANKQGRVAANTVCGHEDRFPGVLGSTVCKICELNVARTGLSEDAARELGHRVVTCIAPGPDRAHYYPAHNPIIVKLIVNEETRKLLGVQAVGPGDVSKRIDVAATAIAGGMTVDQVAHLDLAYAPPFSPAMDPLITAANVARNKLDGFMQSVTPMQAAASLDAEEAPVLLDVRSPGEFSEVRIPGSVNIPLGALPSRMSELSKEKEIIVFCKVSLRGWEAATKLKANGFRVKVLDGGVSVWPYRKETGREETSAKGSETKVSQ